MSRIGDRLVVTISGDSNIADGVAHPWDGAEHIHIRTDSRTTFPGEEYKIEVIEKGSGYWVGEVRKNIDVRPVNEKIKTNKRTQIEVYWIKTGKSYCYHTDPNCRRLEKHEGEWGSAYINRNKGDVPKPVKERRPCPDCD